MRRLVSRLPMTATEEPKRELLRHQIMEYECLAQKLVASARMPRGNDVTTIGAVGNDGYNRRAGVSATEQENQGIFLDASRSTETQQNGGRIVTRRDQNLHAIHRLANQASNKLANALDLDELADQPSLASQMYMESANLYLQALQLATNAGHGNKHISEVIPALKKRIESTLDRVEHLKNPKLGSNPLNMQSQNESSDNAQSLMPEEVSVLKESSTTVSGLFLPWSDSDARTLSNEATQAARFKEMRVTRFTDPDGYMKLSIKQKSVFSKWARPDEIVQIRHQTGLTRTRQQKPILIHTISPYSIKQQYVTDCSFIASLCVTAAFERRFQKRLITSSIYPQSSDAQPFYNPLGKYMVKLWLNGVARCVTIDDFLPIDKHGNILCSNTTGASSQHLELWVCLIEKAYMKMCGGYDFPGSNSGVDLFSLTGWIPERVHFSKSADEVRDFEILPERAWERISSASSFGDCLITVSSHLNLSEVDAERLGLVMGHSYAVLSVIETSSGLRMLQLKNPWALKGWKGRYSRHDVAGWNDKALRTEVGYDPDKAKHQDDGVFWICWDDILNYFQNFHLSWNPFLFRFRTTTHNKWPRDQGPKDDTFNVGENPQYILSLSDEAIRQNATVWILISRHVSKQEQEGGDVSDFLTVHVHRNKGHRETIWYPGKSGNCCLTGAYTNNPHVLVRYDVLCEADKHLSLVLSQYQKTNDLRYTLSLYSTESFVLSKPRAPLTNCIKRSGYLNVDGGPLGSKQVVRNPMFALTVAEDKTIMEVNVSTAKNIALNLIVLPVARAGHRLEQASGPAVVDSGKYRHGFVVTERTVLRAGSYVLMVSCFTPQQEGKFDLECRSSQPTELRSL